VKDLIRVFLGYDPAEAITWHVFNHSIQRRSSQPITVTPVSLSQLKDVHNRPWHEKQSNEFSFSRWLVPYLCGYEGWAIFADCDMLCQGDIAELWDMRDERYAVQVVKHNHVPHGTSKYLDRPQTPYEKKNWSSVMLINCRMCKALTPKYVENATGLELHQFKWLNGDALIGEIPREWNHLVGYDAPNPEAKILHYTEGGPYFQAYKDTEYAQEWIAELCDAMHCEGASEMLKDVYETMRAQA